MPLFPLHEAQRFCVCMSVPIDGWYAEIQIHLIFPSLDELLNFRWNQLTVEWNA